MGWASAFGAGLVKGFHQNILKEQQARAGEKAKLDGYEAMIFKTAMEGGDDVNTNAINKISEIVRSGRQDLENQGSIDIFGRPGKRLELDVLDTAGIVNNTNTTMRIGNVQMPVVGDYYNKTIRVDPTKRSSTFFDSLSKLGPEKVKELFKSKEDKAALSQTYTNNIKSYLRPLVLGKDGKIVQVLGPDAISVHSWMKDIVSMDKSSYQLSIENLNSTANYKSGDFILPIQGTEGILTNFEDMKFGNREQTLLKGLSNLHGFQDSGEFIFNAASSYKDKGKFMNGLKTTLDLYEMNAHEPKTTDEMAKIGAYIVEKKLDKDPLASAYMLAPLVYSQDNVRLDQLRKLGFKEALDNSDFKGQFNKFTGKTLEKFNQNYDNLIRTDGQLKKFVGYLKQANLKPGSTIQGVYSFFESIFGKTGTVDQIANLLGVDGETVEGKRILSRINSASDSYGEGTLQAKIATLKFVIAADLARAEDSQGRLSDQDLARNLAKLGDKTFTTIEGALGAVSEIQSDITNKIKSQTVLNEIKNRAMARGYFTRDERRLLQADYMARRYVTAHNRSLPSDGGAEELVSSTIDQVMNPELFDKADSALQGSGGESVHKSKDGKKYVLVRGGQITKEISSENINKATNDGTISFVEVGGVDDIKGETSPFGNDPNPNVSKPITKVSPSVGTVPNSGTSMTGADLGVTSFADSAKYLEKINGQPTGFYVIGGKKYSLTNQNPLTFQLVP